MSIINSSDWKPFQIGGTDGLFSVVKGKRLTKAKMKDGVINFIGSSAENNGVTNHIGNEENVHPGNLITVSYNGSVGEAFYQENEFVASDDVNVLYPKFEMNKYIGLYLCPILRRIGKNYVFIDKWKKDDMEKDTIYLPVTQKGKPDWNYMEKYMKDVEEKAKESLVRLQSTSTKKTKKQDTTNWREFVVSRLFEIRSPAKRSLKSYDDGTTPYVSSGSVNNGIISYLKPKGNEDIEKGGCITVSPLDGSSFYQEQDFLGRGGAGSAISLLYNDNLTKYSALFICAIIKVSAHKFGYNDALTSDNLKTLKLKLPIKCNAVGSYRIDKERKFSDEGFIPDWKYMEDYMKKMENKTNKKLMALM